MKRILVVDDDPSMVAGLVKGFELEHYQAHGTADEHQALAMVEEFQPDLVVLDIFFGQSNKKTGLDILQKIRARRDKETLPIIMVTGLGESTDLLESMDNGANDFMSKPFAMIDLIEKARRILEGKIYPAAGVMKPWQERIVGKSKVIFDLTMQIWKAVDRKEDVLLLGETGTGKDLVARIYHHQSKWCTLPLQPIYCTNFPTDTLFESELFGHKKGAFTGATEDKIGLIQAAQGGIVFLNEIGEISPQQQAKLLNLLENKTIRPLGATKDIKVNVVLIMATNGDLKNMVDKKEFRNDLYQRVNKCRVIEIAPLREHLDDIPQLVEYFIEDINRTAKNPIKAIDSAVLALFKTLFWDGNVRQLQHCIQDAARRCVGGKIILRDVAGFIERNKIFPLHAVLNEPAETTLDMDYKNFKALVLKRLEREYFNYHLRKNNGNVSQTSKTIGIRQRQQLDQILKRLGIKQPKAKK